MTKDDATGVWDETARPRGVRVRTSSPRGEGMNKNHLEIMQSGVQAWNGWRTSNVEVVPNLSDAYLGGANLRYANLRGADLSDAHLGDANLRGADLSGADLRYADLREADLGRANLGGANLSDANLRDADLYEADLYGANLYGANLREADLREANLRGADLRGAGLHGARLRNADFREADLREADLRDGETWETYLAEVVPALLRSGGRELGPWVEQSWNCHSWENCPMAAAFGVEGVEGIPAIHQPRAHQFVQFFDAGLIPLPEFDTQETSDPYSGISNAGGE